MKIRKIRLGITNYCNLGCAYCFFHGSLSSDKNRASEMSLPELQEVLRYCKDGGVETVVIHGGEPMMHSQIVKIIKMLKENKIKIDLLTNALFDHSLLKRLNKTDFQYCFINYNHPDTYKKIDDWELVNRNIKKMCELEYPISLSYNLYEKNPDYKFFIEGIRRYRIKHIRWDVAKPSKELDNKYLNLEEVFSSIDIMAKFMQDCLNVGAYPQPDCHFPICLSIKKDFNFMRKYLFIPRSVCFPLLDINPGLNVLTCPSSLKVRDIKITDFENLLQAWFFLKGVEDEFKWKYYLLESCKDCIYWLNKLCEGGCLGYKRVLQNEIITPRDLALFLSKNKNGNFQINSINKLNLANTLSSSSSFFLFKLGVALLQSGWSYDAFKVFSMMENSELQKEEQRYVELFMKDFIALKYRFKNHSNKKNNGLRNIAT